MICSLATFPSPQHTLCFNITDTAVKLFTLYDMLVCVIPKFLILNSLNLPVTNRNSCYLHIYNVNIDAVEKIPLNSSEVLPHSRLASWSDSNFQAFRNT